MKYLYWKETKNKKSRRTYFQSGQRAFDGVTRRGFDERELSGIGQPHGDHLKDHGIERYALNLRRRVRVKVAVLFLRKQAVTHSRTRTSGSSFPLFSTGPADPKFLFTHILNYYHLSW